MRHPRGALGAGDGDAGQARPRPSRRAAAVGDGLDPDDYTVFKSPRADFRAAYERSGLGTTMHYLDRGDTFSFSFAEL